MTERSADLARFLAATPEAIVCELTRVRGSSPRAEGTFMLVGRAALFGTIGGGALEYLVIEHARRLLAEGRAQEVMDVPLGPEIGQCCGGRVAVMLHYADAQVRAGLMARAEAEETSLPHVYIFGAGHVGRVLAQILSLLPVHLDVFDTRRAEIAALPEGISGQAVAMPEAMVRAAPSGTSYVIVTHDHALDFLIAQEALSRPDSPYIGMVGSRTKRAKFSSWFLEQGGERAALERLVLPIGAQGLGDKRPAVIAALAAAEIVVHIRQRDAGDAHAHAPGQMRVAIGR